VCQFFGPPRICSCCVRHARQVIQRRNSREKAEGLFVNNSWYDYKTGFGNPYDDGQYYLGTISCTLYVSADRYCIHRMIVRDIEKAQIVREKTIQQN